MKHPGNVEMSGFLVTGLPQLDPWVGKAVDGMGWDGMGTMEWMKLGCLAGVDVIIEWDASKQNLVLIVMREGLHRKGGKCSKP